MNSATTQTEPTITHDVRNYWGVPTASSDALAKLDAIEIELPKKSAKKGRK